MATYIVYVTSKATRSFGTSLHERLLATHLKSSSGTSARSVKVISHFAHNATGNSLKAGYSNEMDHRYIRVVVEIPTQSKSHGEKQDLMNRILECCREYQGKYAKDCEYDIQISEIDPANTLKVMAGSVVV